MTPAVALDRHCFGCGIPINALPPGETTCAKQRCKRHQENERRRTILSAVVAAFKEVSTDENAPADVAIFTQEWLGTLAKAGVA